MADDVGVRKLVELFFLKQVINISEMTAPNSSIPACLLTRDFAQSMNVVLSTKQTVVLCRWRKLVDTCYDKMFTSYEMYLTYIMFALQTEYQCHQNIFESFISVCAVLKNLSNETHSKTEMDFRNLNPDIFMVFYHSSMKKLFRRRGGFQRLVEYIRGHRYNTWNTNDLSVNTLDADKAQKLREEIIEEGVHDLLVNSDETANDATSLFLAQKVLKMTSFVFPTLLSKHELVTKLVAFRRKEITTNVQVKKRVDAYLKFEPLEKVWKDCSNSNPNSKTNRAAEQKEDIAEDEKIIETVIRYNHSKSSGLEKANNRAAEQKEDIAEHEKIIEAVIRCNHSKSSGREEANNPLLNDVYGILEHLKDNIKSFMEVLDQYDVE